MELRRVSDTLAAAGAGVPAHAHPGLYVPWLMGPRPDSVLHWDGSNWVGGPALGRAHPVLLLGDSITANPVYAAALQAALGGDWDVLNGGVGGDTTARMRDRFTRAMTDSTEVVVVLGGINDIVNDYDRVTVTQVNLQAIYTAAKAAGAKVIAVTVLPFKASAFWTAGRQAALDALNAWIAGTAADVDVVWNAYAAFEDPGAADTMLAAYAGPDWLHPNDTGSAALGTGVHGATTWTPATTAPALHLPDGDVYLNQSLRTTDSPKFAGLDVGPILAPTLSLHNADAAAGTGWLLEPTSAGYLFFTDLVYGTRGYFAADGRFYLNEGLTASDGAFAEYLSVGGGPMGARILTITADHAAADHISLQDSNAAPYTGWDIGLGTGYAGDALGFYAGALAMKLTPSGDLTIAGALVADELRSFLAPCYLLFSPDNYYDIGSPPPAITWSTVGDGAWAVVGTVSRTAAALTVNGFPLDHLVDADAAAVAYWYRDVPFEAGTADRTLSFLVARYTPYAHHAVYLFDQTADVNRGEVVIDFIGVVPVVSAGNGAPTIISVEAEDTGWRIIVMASGVIGANTNRLYVVPAQGAAADEAGFYLGDIRFWNTGPTTGNSPRSGYFKTSLAVGIAPAITTVTGTGATAPSGGVLGWAYADGDAASRAWGWVGDYANGEWELVNAFALLTESAQGSGLDTPVLVLGPDGATFWAYGEFSLELSGDLSVPAAHFGTGFELVAGDTSGWWGFNSYKGALAIGNNLWIGGGGTHSHGTVEDEWDGSGNIALGQDALAALTTGTNNFAFGTSTMLSMTTGDNNVGLGSLALLGLLTGSANIGIGNQALLGNTSGSNNIAIGLNAGRYDKDWGALADPENSIYIGRDARGYTSADDNSIVIGYAALGAGPNTVVLGNDDILTTYLKGNVTIPSGKVFKVNNVQVVGAQGAAVADASGGTVQDAEARTQLNALLAKLRTHGLIAT